MDINQEELRKIIAEFLDKFDYIRPDEIPDIPLYMDQVTTFMNNRMDYTRRYPEDKILTKTMINNYAKNHLLPPPEKKKYSRNHVLLMVFIYYFKNFLSITDIQKLLTPLNNVYFDTESEHSLSEVYTRIFNQAPDKMDKLLSDLEQETLRCSRIFEDYPEEEQDFLQLFTSICLLSFDVYFRKQVIEKLLDQFPENTKKGTPKKK